MSRGCGSVNPLSESFVLSHLGYWVDNGAPYYHTTAGYNVSLGMEACTSAGTCTQEDALKAVQADFGARKIPIRYMRASALPSFLSSQSFLRSSCAGTRAVFGLARTKCSRLVAEFFVDDEPNRCLWCSLSG